MSSIPTTYNGIRFRSRLEAKWAVFFDHLKWRWHYEPLDCNGWIPDFLIETKSNPILVEVKPILKYDPTVTAKIYKAFNLPRPLKEDEEEYSIERWDCEYHFLVCGLAPFEPEYDDYAIGWISDDFDVDFLPAVVTLTDEGKWGLTSGSNGLWFDRVLDIGGKESRAWVGADYLDPLWAAACNETQWRKPR